MVEFEVWAEKYRPESLKEVINQMHVTERLKAFVKGKNVPHCLFAGTAGTGKTTCALAMAYDLYGKNWKANVLETNASDERGIDVVRHKIKDFSRMKAIGNVPYKLVILDEADALTRDAQQALRRTMENFTRTARFILICNYSSRIIDPIQSRTAIFRFKPLSDEDQKNFVDRIVKGEKLKITKSGIEAILNLAEGDLRRVANLLQASASLKKVRRLELSLSPLAMVSARSIALPPVSLPRPGKSPPLAGPLPARRTRLPTRLRRPHGPK